MKRKYNVGKSLLFLLLLTGGAWIKVAKAEEGIPALLQFAEEYQNKKVISEKQGSSLPEKTTSGESNKKNARRTASELGLQLDRDTLRQKIKKQESKIAQQKDKISSLENELHSSHLSLDSTRESLVKARQEIQELAKKAPEKVMVDFSSFTDFFRNIRKSILGTPGELELKQLLNSSRQEVASKTEALASSQDNERKLKKQLDEYISSYQANSDQLRLAQVSSTEMQELIDELRQRLSDEEHSHTQLSEGHQKEQVLIQQLSEELNIVKGKLEQSEQDISQKNTEIASLKRTDSSSTKHIDELNARLKESELRLASQDSELLALKNERSEFSRREQQLSPEMFKLKDVRRNYAEGSMLGLDIIDILEERKDWGIDIDRNIVLAGIIDAFSGGNKLNKNEFNAALAESEELVKDAREKVVKKQQLVGDAYVEKFKSKKDVKQSASGFWYRVDYVGDELIADNSVVDIVVKESLTDGTVIQDMDLNGKVLSMPVNAFPPLFREAIGYLKNHGSITLVVPPSLAYGEAGYPPKIPPNSTMVYELRIDGIGSDKKE